MSFSDDPMGQEESSLSLPGFVTDPMGLLFRRWKWMLLGLIVGLAGTAAVVHTLTPTYSGRATVLVTTQRISEEFFRPTVENDPLEKISAILGELTSRHTLVSLIEKYDLYPTAPDAEAIPMEEKVGKVRRDMVIEPDTSNGAYRPGSSAVVYGIQFTAERPQTAADVANDLASAFIDTHLRMRSRQARLTTEFLRRELRQLESELTKQERAITEYKQTHRGELPGELQTNLGRLDRLQQQRQSLALQIAEAETRLATVSSRVPIPDSPEQRVEAARARLDELRTIYTPEHPSVVAATRQLETLEAEVAAGGSATASNSRGAAATIAELQRQLAQTVAEFEDLDRRVAQTPKRQEELAALEQRAEVLRESHLEFQRKVGQAELAEAVESAQQGERATILDKAVPPNRPDNSPLKFIVVGIIGSFGMAVGIGVLLELIDSVVVNAAEIEQEFRLPVLGSVARIR